MSSQSPDKRTQVIVAIIGATAVVVAAIIRLGEPIVEKWIEEESTITPEASSTHAVSVESSIYYDDFSNRAFDGNANPDLWSKHEDFECSVQQENGVAVFRTNGSETSSHLCFLSISSAQFNEVGFMEAEVYAESGATGGHSIGIVEFTNDELREDTLWIAQCGVQLVPNENLAKLFFNVDDSYPESEPETYETASASTEKWYKMRLEAVPETAEVRCYADDKLLGSHRPRDAGALRTGSLDRHILSFWTPQSNSAFRFDNVRLPPSQH